jgi:hypothetical protein
VCASSPYATDKNLVKTGDNREKKDQRRLFKGKISKKEEKEVEEQMR